MCLHCERIGHMPYLWKRDTNAPMSTLHLDANAWTQHETESTRPNANYLIVNFVATYEPLRKRSLQRAILFLTRTWRHQAQQPWQGDHTQNHAKQYGSINSSAKASIYRLIMIDLKHQDDLCKKSGVPNHFPCAQKEGMHEGTGVIPQQIGILIPLPAKHENYGSWSVRSISAWWLPPRNKSIAMKKSMCPTRYVSRNAGFCIAQTTRGLKVTLITPIFVLFNEIIVPKIDGFFTIFFHYCRQKHTVITRYQVGNLVITSMFHCNAVTPSIHRRHQPRCWQRCQRALPEACRWLSCRKGWPT